MGHQLDGDDPRLPHSVVLSAVTPKGFQCHMDPADWEMPAAIVDWLHTMRGDWSGGIQCAEAEDGSGGLEFWWLYRFERDEDAAMFMLFWA